MAQPPPNQIPEINITETHAGPQSPPPPPPLPQNPQQYAHPSLKVHRRLSEEAEMLVPRPSILLPHLRDTEKEFFELVGSGTK